MVHFKQIIYLFIISMLTLLCSCNDSSNAEANESKAIFQSTTNDNNTTYETIESIYHQHVVSTEKATEEFIAEDVISADNWYMDEYVVPQNWIALLTSEDALNQFDDIVGNKSDINDIEDSLLLLMNKNIIAFNVIQLTIFDFYEPSETNHQNDNIRKAYSEYFNSIDEIYQLFYQTYTDDHAYELLFGDDQKKNAKFFEDNEKNICINTSGLGTWTTEPFAYPTYIENVGTSDDYCEFIWHYISYDFENHENNTTNEMIPHHQQMLCRAVIENNEWQLSSIIFDNPALSLR